MFSQATGIKYIAKVLRNQESKKVSGNLYTNWRSCSEDSGWYNTAILH